MNHRIAFVLVALGLAVISLPGLCEPYPSKPVRLLVGFAPGGIADTMSRFLASKLSEFWATGVQVENRPGAGGSIAAAIAARAPADGYTLFSCDVATHAIDATIYGNLPYDPLKDFTAITLIGSAPNVLIVSPALEARSLSEFLAYARAYPGKLNVASSDVGSSQNLSTNLLKSMARIDIVAVPYKGGGPALTDLLGGQVPAMFGALSTAMPSIKSGRVRALAVTSPRRSPQLPEVPTIAESGVPGYSVTSWRGICAPAGLSPALVIKIHDDVARAIDLVDTRQRFSQLGIDAETTSPEQFRSYIKSEIEKWGPVIKALGITAQ
jgi:tripartite-type tricarboxylate transporter receptor subunit TctC